MIENTGWLLVLTVGPLILAACVIYAYTHRRRLSQGEKAQQHRAVEELYEDTPAQRAQKERLEREPELPQGRRPIG